MTEVIFLYRGRLCQIIWCTSDSLIQIINPHMGRKKTVPTGGVIAVPYAECRGSRG
jgi:hypothetical protein